MRRRLARLSRLFAIVLTTVLALSPGVASGQERGPRAAAAPSAEDPNGARVIVKFNALGGLMRALRANAAAAAQGPGLAAALAQRHGLALTDGRAIGERSQVVHGDKTLTSAALATLLAADPDVEYAVPDYRRHLLATPNDPLYSAQPAGSNVTPAVGQWYLRTPDATFVSAIDATAAWAITTGSSDVVIADLDTGVRFDHPDLATKLLPGRNFVSTNGNTGRGWSADASDPGDWTTANQCGSGQPAQPSSWHGTQTAGILGAQTNNGIGMASVGYNVMVMPVRVLAACGGFDSDIQAAMLWAGGVGVPGVPTNPTPARVINMSLGGTGSCAQSYVDAIGQLIARSVTIVAAAGNAEGLAVATPANCTGVVAVAAVRNVGTKVGFSSLGPEVAIAAPGGNCVSASGACLYPILTTTNAGATTPAANTYTDGLNDPSLGTSFSTPLVTGTVALILSVNPTLTPAQVRSFLQSSARLFPAQPPGSAVPICHAPTSSVQDECYCTQSTCGAGLLDAGAAVAAATQGAAPSVSVSASASTVTVGTNVGFNSNATAPGGLNITSYQWSVSSSGTIAALSGATNTASAIVATTGTGTFTVTLRVTDSAGLSASASASVAVNPPAAPAVRIVPSATVVSAGTAVTFDGSGSTASSPAAVAAYAWSITSTTTPSLAQFTSATNGATATVATAGSGSGSFTVQLAVTDTFGQIARSTQTVSVTALGPLASISASAGSVTVGDSVSFDGSGSTVPGGRTITGYQWSLTSGGNVAAFSGSTTGARANVTTRAAGSFTVTLTVTDSAGAQAVRSAEHVGDSKYHPQEHARLEQRRWRRSLRALAGGACRGRGSSAA
jgi:serine protease